MAEWLIPEGKLTPITLTDQKVEEQFKTIFAELESGTVTVCCKCRWHCISC